MGVSKIFSYGGKTVWMLIAGFIVAAILSVMLLTKQLSSATSAT